VGDLDLAVPVHGQDQDGTPAGVGSPDSLVLDVFRVEGGEQGKSGRCAGAEPGLHAKRAGGECTGLARVDHGLIPQ
jgi:hypothetical protein